MGVLSGIFIVIGAAVYHCYPDAIKNIFADITETNTVTAVDAVSYDASSSTNITGLDDAPSSPQASFSDTADPETDSNAEKYLPNVVNAPASSTNLTSDSIQAGPGVASTDESSDSVVEAPAPACK